MGTRACAAPAPAVRRLRDRKCGSDKPNTHARTHARQVPPHLTESDGLRPLLPSHLTPGRAGRPRPLPGEPRRAHAPAGPPAPQRGRLDPRCPARASTESADTRRRPPGHGARARLRAQREQTGLRFHRQGAGGGGGGGAVTAPPSGAGGRTTDCGRPRTRSEASESRRLPDKPGRTPRTGQGKEN